MVAGDTFCRIRQCLEGVDDSPEYGTGEEDSYNGQCRSHECDKERIAAESIGQWLPACEDLYMSRGPAIQHDGLLDHEDVGRMISMFPRTVCCK